MDDKDTNKNRYLSTASIITLIVGLISVSVSLYIFYASRPKPSLILEQLTPITYASTQALSSLGDVSLLINGKKISELRAIPVRVRNTGNIPISNLQGSTFYNLVGPIIIQIKTLEKNEKEQGLIGIQAPSGADAPFTITYDTNNEKGRIKVDLRNLNVNEETNFTILYSGSENPEIEILGNPLLGGDVALVKNSFSLFEEPKTLWERFKRLWLSKTLGVIFLAQFSIVSIFLLFGAYFLKKQQNEKLKDQAMEESDAKKRVLEELNAKKEEELKVILSQVPPDIIDIMKQGHIEIPIDSYRDININNAKISLFSLFVESLKRKWEDYLNKKYPIPKEYTSHYSWSTPWWDWEEYVKSILLVGLPSLMFGVAGYFLLYY